jgi:hypothetical protein
MKNAVSSGAPNSDIIICIPRIEASISNDYVSRVFTKLRIGAVQKVTDVPLRSDNEYKRMFLKIKWDLSQENGAIIYNLLKSGNTANIVYEMPWFWKIIASKL